MKLNKLALLSSVTTINFFIIIIIILFFNAFQFCAIFLDVRLTSTYSSKNVMEPISHKQKQKEKKLTLSPQLTFLFFYFFYFFNQRLATLKTKSAG